MDRCDLHTHSTYSDGTYTPAQLVKEAKALGLHAIALTDHNTVAGLPEFMEAGAQYGVLTVPGVEFSTDYEGTELHILGLFIAPNHYEAVNGLLLDGIRAKEQSNLDLVDTLNRLGFGLDYAAIKASTPGGQVNRAHIAAELTRLGCTESIPHAFKTLLSRERGLYHEPKRPDAFQTIRFIRSIGAVAVLAHPFLNLDEAPLRRFLVRAKQCGLDGMETLYTKYSPETAALASAIAGEFGLLPSGGSDFHGDNKPGTMLGCGRGNLCVPYSIFEALHTARG